MKRRIMILAALICAAFLATIAVQYTTHAQESAEQEGGQEEGARPGMGRGGRPGGDRPGGRPGGGRMDPGQFAARMLPLEAQWAYISFELDITDESLVRIWTIYKEAWKGREDMAKKMSEAAGDRSVMRDIRAMSEDIQTEVATKLQDVLSPEQMEKFTKWQEEYRERQRSRFQRGGRPGGGRGRPRPPEQPQAPEQPESSEQPEDSEQ